MESLALTSIQFPDTLNYICATDRPKRTLMSALAALIHEVELTNRAAITHFHTFSEN